MGIRPTKAELQADIRALVEGADRQAAVIEDLHKQLRMAQAEATQLRAHAVNMRSFADTVGRCLGAKTGAPGHNESHRDDADTLRIACEIHKLAQGGNGDNAAEVLRLLIEEHDAPWSAPAWLAELLDLDDGDEVTRANVEAVFRRFRDPIEAVFGKGDTLAGLADRVVTWMNGRNRWVIAKRLDGGGWTVLRDGLNVAEDVSAADALEWVQREMHEMDPAMPLPPDPDADDTDTDEGRIAIQELAAIDALCRDMRVRRRIVDRSPASRLAFIGYLFGLVDGAKADRP